MLRRLLLPTPYRALVPLLFVAKVAVVALVVVALILYLRQRERNPR
jgi:hypothetical protein